MKILGFKLASEQSVIAIIGGVVGFLFGADNDLIKVLMFLIICDFVTGVIAGIAEKKLSSDVAFRGIARKVVELILVSIGHQIDFYIFGDGNAIMSSLAFLFISSEGISLLENSSRLGVPIPKKLLETLVQLKVSAGGVVTEDELKNAKESLGENNEVNNETPSSNNNDEFKSENLARNVGSDEDE